MIYILQIKTKKLARVKRIPANLHFCYIIYKKRTKHPNLCNIKAIILIFFVSILWFFMVREMSLVNKTLEKRF